MRIACDNSELDIQVNLNWPAVAFFTSILSLSGPVCTGELIPHVLKRMVIANSEYSRYVALTIHPLQLPERLPNLHSLFLLRMKENLELIDLLPDAQNLPPKVLVAGKVLLYHIADSVYCEAVIGIFKTIGTNGIRGLHFLSTLEHTRVRIFHIGLLLVLGVH